MSNPLSLNKARKDRDRSARKSQADQDALMEIDVWPLTTLLYLYLKQMTLCEFPFDIKRFLFKSDTIIDTSKKTKSPERFHVLELLPRT